MHAIISIHDVMPQTLDRVEELLGKMEHLEPSAITLLVVPGLDWPNTQIETLKSLQHTGYRLAGHGWHHRIKTIRTFYHHLHAELVSRTAAEHLSLNAREIDQLMRDCYHWFADKGLTLPDLYVPPAWAMGKISRKQLKETPFRYFESTAGLYDSETGRQILLPLVGFEADTRLRATTLTCWNAANRLLGSVRRPVRLSIHPDDLQLLLGKSLVRYLERVNTAVSYASVL
jgi:hypothetical protein